MKLTKSEIKPNKKRKTVIKEQKSLVSVIVASYNHAEYLSQRMNGLLAQSYKNMEIIVIDDKSSDNSLEVLSKYHSEPTVKIIAREQNSGWINVSNYGAEIASGEYIIFANCDDDCDPLMIERLVEGLEEKSSAGVAYCRSILIDPENNVLGDDFEGRETAFKQKCSSDTLISGKEMGKFLLDSCVIPNLSAVLIRKDCFSFVGGLTKNYLVCGDWEFFFKIAEQFDFFYIIEPLNKFRQHGTTIRSQTKGRIVLDEYFRLLSGEIKKIDLNFFEKVYYRVHLLKMWSLHFFRNPYFGIQNFFFHLVRLFRLDMVSVLLVPAGFIAGFSEVVKILWKKIKVRNKSNVNK